MGFARQCSSKNTGGSELPPVAPNIHGPLLNSGIGHQTPRRSGQKFSNRLAVIEEVLGAAVEVGEFYFEVDAEDAVDRAHDVLEADLAVDRAFGTRVGFADDLAHCQVATEEGGAAGVGPVFSAGAERRDIWRGTERGEHNHRGICRVC